MQFRCPLLLLAATAFAQAPDWTQEFTSHYSVLPNITYATFNNFESKLDLYQRRDATVPQPTLIYIHGGGWTGGSKEASLGDFLPWLEMGWTVVNVEYRLKPWQENSMSACPSMRPESISGIYR